MRCFGWCSDSSEHVQSLPSFGSRMGVRLHAPELVGKTTAQKTMKRIWELLMDDESRIIGVHGMAGVGKTAIMMNINNQILDAREDRFDKVIWVPVSKDMDICKLQDVVANAIDLDLSNERDEAKRAAILYKALNRAKRFVLILDDVWEPFSLYDDVGIIRPNKLNGCKLVITTRSSDVCSVMECKQDCIVKVDLLSSKEAKKLLKVVVGVVFTTEMKDVAVNIVQECACLPMKIVEIGGRLKGINDIKIWRSALNNLRNSIEGSVFKSLKESYDRLPNETIKKCFLYCALYPEDWKISSKELVDYWSMDGLIEEKSTQDELDRGEIILSQLKQNGLLESVNMDFDDYKKWGEGVRMHHSYRDMAIHTASHSYISKCGLNLEDLPKETEWEESFEGASFMSNKIRTLSMSPKCPKLSTLFLNKNPHLSNIMHNFFVHMKGLKILDLRDNFKMESLPDSLSDLVELRVLRFSRCLSLKKVPSVARLLSLKMLELDETDIKELPQGIELLVKLKLLVLHSLSLRDGVLSEFLSRVDESQFDVLAY
ncbi:hypothetical protein ACHQM5_017864 [Ranunculus cassubicifolius]